MYWFGARSAAKHIPPLRGEGARPHVYEVAEPTAARFASSSSGESARTRTAALPSRHTSHATPSPLNGERAGVRGEVVPRLEVVQKLKCTRSQTRLVSSAVRFFQV